MATPGPVVRVAPHELSFNTAQAWKDIYGQRRGHSPFIKSAFYDGGNFAGQAHSIVSERDPAKHGEMRRFLSNAFSDRSLKEQEYLITDVIDEFCRQIGARGAGEDGVDLSKWFNLLTFDVIGELAFGESFNGVRTGVTHFWIDVVLESMGQASFADCLQRFPLLGRLFIRLNPQWMAKMIAGSQKHEGYTMDLINRIAGSETTATTLSVAMNYVCRDASVLSQLQTEIHTSFETFTQITSTSTASLKYLHAVCLEALRIFPPLPLGLPRVVPKGGDTVDGQFVPENTIVSVNPFAATMTKANFENPWAFRPERWLGVNKTDELEASQPFSVGTRSCLGRGFKNLRLGWLELKVTLAKLLFQYDVTLLSTEVSWQDEAQMHLLWKRPKVVVRVKPRQIKM
ncbi:MAG: hypothetical protein Q9207_005685 [Kuettlingeria erythrocarpa]